MFRQSTNQNHYPVFGSEWRHWTALTPGRFRRCWEEKTTRSNRMNFRLLERLTRCCQVRKHKVQLTFTILFFSFASRFLFKVFNPGKNDDTPTSPLYADKKYMHQNKFKIILPCSNKEAEIWLFYRVIQWMVNESQKRYSTINHTYKNAFPLLRTNLKGLFSLSFR